MNVSLITSSHSHFDDRIYHHMAYSLHKNGHKVEIVSSLSKLKIEDDISINSFDGSYQSKRKKIQSFVDCLSTFKPDLVICSEPLTTYAAKKYSKKNNLKIIYDITEWYPSKKNLANHNILTKWYHFFKYLFLNLYAFFIADGFIFGEYYKSKIPKILFPNKPFEFISYYPDTRIFDYKNPNLIDNTLKLSYSGKISIEKGFGNFINVVNKLSELNPKLNIIIKIIGFYDEKDYHVCKGLLNKLGRKITVNHYEYQTLKNYIKLINDTDIFLDLRSNDLENSHCLPIKLFYYMAIGRPIIYSNLKAIRKEVEIESFGYLIDPTNTKKIASLILTYLIDRDLYHNHCSNARRLYNTKYNWQIIEPLFLKFINKMIKK